MKLWSDFYDSLLPDVPGCPFGSADYALRQSARDFCEQSLTWTYTHPDISVVNDQSDYTYVPPAEALVHTISYAEFNDKEISAETKDIDMHISDWRNQTGSPKFVLGMPNGIRLVPKPDLEGTLKLIVALKPDNDATGIDDEIYQEYRDVIVHGAMARLMLSPRKPYSKPDLAMHHMQQFTAKTGAAGQRQARNYTTAPLQTSIMKRR